MIFNTERKSFCKFLVLSLVVLLVCSAFCRANIGSTATWVSGSDTIDNIGVYGSKGAADPCNIPGARYGSISWTDSNGNLWLFGGWGYDSAGSFGHLNDLFKYDGINWTWVSGQDTINNIGVYGTKGVPDPCNIPGARNGSISWSDGSGNLWLFGGAGYDSAGSFGYLNDLFKFDGTNWTWVSGQDTVKNIGVYGTQGVVDPNNIPGARHSSISWSDSSGNFWLFGGQGLDSAGNKGRLNDLFKFDGTNWTWVSGQDTINQSGIYGTQGVADPCNVPGARYASISWSDGSGNLWLFGGYGYDSAGSLDYLNDLFKYDGTNWIWVSGQDTVNNIGVYGSKGAVDPCNIPGARYGSISWTDSSSNLWLFGGYGYDSAGNLGRLNDLFKFDGTNWTWVSGQDTVNNIGVYGSKGAVDPCNIPGARYGSISWTDSSSNLWLFGGDGYDSAGSLGRLNDLWKIYIGLLLLKPNGGEVIRAGSTYTITWDTLLPVSDVVVEYSMPCPDFFKLYDENDFTLEDSFGSGGYFSISGGQLYIIPANNNTASVMTCNTVSFNIQETLSLDVPPVSGSDNVVLMCSTTDGQPDGATTYGFRFGRDVSNLWIERYPGGTTSYPSSPSPDKPATLKVARTSSTGFNYSVTIEGTETQLGSFTLPQLDGIVYLHIGAAAYNISSKTFVFDTLQVYGPGNNPVKWQQVTPSNEGNTGSYDWLVPDISSNYVHSRVRISQADNQTHSDTSDSVFTIKKGLVAHWKLDEISGYRAYDSIGANDGTLFGQPRWLPVGGASSGALQLDGTDDYVDCGNDGGLDITDQITVAAWIKTSDANDSDHNPYVTKGDHSYALKHNFSNNIDFFIYDSGWHTVWHPVDSSFNDQWHHVAGTYDSNDLRLYIDGDLKATQPYAGSINSTAAPVWIGSNSEVPVRFYDGLIDDVRIYNYALSVDEILQLLCTRPIEGDLDNNCRVDIADFVLFARNWLECNLEPQEACWE